MQYTEERRESMYTCTSLYKVHNNSSPKYLCYITPYVSSDLLFKFIIVIMCGDVHGHVINSLYEQRHVQFLSDIP